MAIINKAIVFSGHGHVEPCKAADAQVRGVRAACTRDGGGGGDKRELCCVTRELRGYHADIRSTTKKYVIK